MTVTAAAGFVASGVASGIKPDGALDLALVVTEDRRPVAAAAVFTTNKAAAAPVRVSREHLAASGGQAVAVILNSGNANACTGAEGVAHARRMCELVAAELGCATEHVLVCSTGLIGIPLPFAAIEAAIPRAAAALSRDGGADAAEAILTTDTCPKVVSVEGAGYTVGGMAKGAAMLAPSMATMLAVLSTDATFAAVRLASDLRAAVDLTFNRLIVDGCTSTNDTVIALAGGDEDPPPLHDASLVGACSHLANAMAHDAEGATLIAFVEVVGAATEADALRGARKIAGSQLVQCSLFGRDPYWGRIVSEAGSAGVEFDLDRVSVAYNDVKVCAGGAAVDHDVAAVAKAMHPPVVRIRVDLGLGSGEAVVTTTDLTPAYIAENMGTS